MRPSHLADPGLTEKTTKGMSQPPGRRERGCLHNAVFRKTLAQHTSTLSIKFIYSFYFIIYFIFIFIFIFVRGPIEVNFDGDCAGKGTEHCFIAAYT